MTHVVRFRPHISFLFVLLLLSSVAYGQDVAKLERFMQASKVNTASMQILREGRDMIEAQNWQRAADKFNEFIKGYPKDKDLDAALYWHGYALQKQGKTEDAAASLVRLINRFPSSTWRQDAQALLVTLGRKADVDQALQRDNCEIKILALQSLFQADEERAVGIVTEALRANPTTCQGFQSAAVSMLGAHGGARAVPILLDVARTNPDVKLRLTAIKRLGDQHSEPVTDELIKIYDADRTKEVRVQILRALVESRTPRGAAKVMEIARSGDDVQFRQAAIRYIGELKDAASLDELIRIYDTDKTKEIRMQVLRALAQRDDAKARTKIWDIARQGDTPEMRIMAIRVLSDHGRLPLDQLLQLYSGESNLQIKQSLLRAFADNNDPRAREQLFKIAGGSDPLELRGFAIRQLGDKDDEPTVTQLVALYDAEQNQQVKSVLIRAFGDSKHKVAVRKLMTIARNDPSVEMRKVAVRYLGDSKDPDALKFLEELLK
jgi:HEAT repeat protein/outer membrane protein assembly factor BamD (BamD/ComL family)